jgi:hypothetical protein
MHCEPKTGWRHVEVTQQRTMIDFAHQMKWLADEVYPTAKVIRIVLDNLNTHRPASLYETFAPAEARRILRPPKLHFRPECASLRAYDRIQRDQIDNIGRSAYRL